MIKRGVVVADGLAFSCGHTKEEQPSLKLIFNAIEEDLYDGMKLDMMRNPDLSYMAKDGVLLLNSMLTTTENSQDAHKELWKPFMTYFFKEVLPYFSGIPIVFFGAQAKEYERLVNKRSFYTKCVEHPSYANRQERAFKHDNLFSWTNEILTKNQGKDFEVEFIESPPF